MLDIMPNKKAEGVDRNVWRSFLTSQAPHAYEIHFYSVNLCKVVVHATFDPSNVGWTSLELGSAPDGSGSFSVVEVTHRATYSAFEFGEYRCTS